MSNKPLHETDNVPSPCVRKCCLDGDNLCVGCHRTLDEIIGWRDKTAVQKKAIITRITLQNEARLQ